MTDKVWVIVSPEGGISYNIFTGKGKCYADEKEAKLALDSKNEWSKVKGKIEFVDDEINGYSRKFTARLTESPAFTYGNRTMVVIEWGLTQNGCVLESELIDTRYDTTIRRNEDDFKKWVKNYFKNNYSAHTLEIY